MYIFLEFSIQAPKQRVTLGTLALVGILCECAGWALSHTYTHDRALLALLTFFLNQRALSQQAAACLESTNRERASPPLLSRARSQPPARFPEKPAATTNCDRPNPCARELLRVSTLLRLLRKHKFSRTLNPANTQILALRTRATDPFAFVTDGNFDTNGVSLSQIGAKFLSTQFYLNLGSFLSLILSIEGLCIVRIL